MHGVCALSVWSDLIVARTLLVVAAVMAATLAILSATAFGRLAGLPFVPEWAPGLSGVLVLVMRLKFAHLATRAPRQTMLRLLMARISSISPLCSIYRGTSPVPQERCAPKLGHGS